jgi:hypothetical protein
MAKQLPVFPSRVAGKFMVRTFGQLTTMLTHHYEAVLISSCILIAR